MRRPMALVLGAVLLAGCSTTTHWTRPETQDRYFTPEEKVQFKRDLYVCLQESRGGMAGGTGFMGTMMIASMEAQQRQLVGLCLEARGYIQRGENGVPTLSQIPKP